MLLLYASSTLVHSFPEGKVKDLFEIFDHSAIYIFIAGTYTPIMLLVVKGVLGWTLLGIVWGVAVAGVVFKAFFVKRFLYISTILYIAMGWLIVIAWGPLTATLSAGGVQLLVVGGLLYTFGAVFYVWRAFPFHHAVWHIFVLAGSVAHFFCHVILCYSSLKQVFYKICFFIFILGINLNNVDKPCIGIKSKLFSIFTQIKRGGKTMNTGISTNPLCI